MDKKAEIDILAAEYISTVKTLSPDQRVERLQKIQNAYSKCKEYSDDKVQLAMQTYEMVDKHIRRLDADLARFEADLKDKMEGSDFESSGGRGYCVPSKEIIALPQRIQADRPGGLGWGRVSASGPPRPLEDPELLTECPREPADHPLRKTLPCRSICTLVGLDFLSRLLPQQLLQLVEVQGRRLAVPEHTPSSRTPRLRGFSLCF
ncbi:hypothetical protein H8959_012260 [Pygathrix nigripes]